MFSPAAEPHRSIPLVPGKKPVMPPPVGKKPVNKHADPKLMAQTDDHKVKESQKGKFEVTSRYMCTASSCFGVHAGDNCSFSSCTIRKFLNSYT